MDKILFRAKEKKNNTWIYGLYIQKGDMHLILPKGQYRSKKIHLYTLGQYVTTDPYGCDVYEGDILADEQKTINGKRQTTCTWLLSDDRIIKSWDGTKIAGLDKYNPRVEITITPLITDITTETDPYIIKQLKEENNLF